MNEERIPKILNTKWKENVQEGDQGMYGNWVRKDVTQRERRPWSEQVWEDRERWRGLDVRQPT
jgi:hypothetical protein